ncbi:hypothetical protein Tco_1133366, partial [Tanacetum coccineum]
DAPYVDALDVDAPDTDAPDVDGLDVDALYVDAPECFRYGWSPIVWCSVDLSGAKRKVAVRRGLGFGIESREVEYRFSWFGVFLSRGGLYRSLRSLSVGWGILESLGVWGDIIGQMFVFLVGGSLEWWSVEVVEFGSLCVRFDSWMVILGSFVVSTARALCFFTRGVLLMRSGCVDLSCAVLREEAFLVEYRDRDAFGESAKSLHEEGQCTGGELISYCAVTVWRDGALHGAWGALGDLPCVSICVCGVPSFTGLASVGNGSGDVAYSSVVGGVLLRCCSGTEIGFELLDEELLNVHMYFPVGAGSLGMERLRIGAVFGALMMAVTGVFSFHLDAPYVDALDVDATDVDAPDVDGLDVDAPYVDAPDADWLDADGPDVDAVDTDTDVPSSGGPIPHVKRQLDRSGIQASVFMAMTSDHNRSELGIQDHSNEQSSSKLVPKVVPLAVKTATSRQELELLFHHHIAMLRTTEKRLGSIRLPNNILIHDDSEVQKVVKLGIHPMIQQEPEDLPKDNPQS